MFVFTSILALLFIGTGFSMFLVIVPRLVLLPIVGFQTVFSGWASYIANIGSALSLVAIPVAFARGRATKRSTASSEL